MEWPRAISPLASADVRAFARESVTAGLQDPFAIGQVGVPCVALTLNEPTHERRDVPPT